MSRRKNKRASSEDEVKLNMAAMLDMAFQLLTFFILTFKPAPVEAPIVLRMPDPAPISTSSKSPPVGNDTKTTDPLVGVKQLNVSLYSDAKGDLGKIYIGPTLVAEDGPQKNKIQTLISRLHQQFTNPANPFDTLVLMVGADMRYDAVMQVVDSCALLKFADGKPLEKLTFVELPVGAAKKK